MKPSRITNYDSTLSVEENAANNNVTTAAIRSYIQVRGIDRATERQIYLYNILVFPKKVTKNLLLLEK